MHITRLFWLLTNKRISLLPLITLLTRINPSHGPARDGHQVDAIPVARLIGEVVAEMGAIDGDSLAVLEAPHVLPDHLLVPERRPAVRLGLLLEVLEAPAARGDEQGLARDGIVVRGLLLAINLFEKVGGLPVPGVLGVVAVEAADLVRGLPLAVPSEVLLHRGFRGAVRLGGHDGLVSHDRELDSLGHRRALASVAESLGDSLGGHGSRFGGAALLEGEAGG